MTAIELLQQIGLNKYEAEAYSTLLSEGSLTGYELGKRSQVPLSRSYEILERLVQKGLALVQPGDPPRYAAQQPRRWQKNIVGAAHLQLRFLAMRKALELLQRHRAKHTARQVCITDLHLDGIKPGGEVNAYIHAARRRIGRRH